MVALTENRRVVGGGKDGVTGGRGGNDSLDVRHASNATAVVHLTTDAVERG